MITLLCYIFCKLDIWLINLPSQVCKAEGFMSLMKGAGANVLRGVAGAGVLSGFDSIKATYVAWKVGGKSY